MSKTEKAPEKKRSDRVIRGGGWRNVPQHARDANRYNDAPGSRGNNLGVRLIEVVDEQD